ncbi:hypothetical protein B296_00022590 [Ensete ventricosum]|uniref:Uncharacterized protein n=1 Tax=Ensete ventricosum TaxID=4639 RepID=A0A426Y140_ENSVE|nr:hypothetical protein B296_00022590 [Ensete ventricosum]
MASWLGTQILPYSTRKLSQNVPHGLIHLLCFLVSWRTTTSTVKRKEAGKSPSLCRTTVTSLREDVESTAAAKKAFTSSHASKSSNPGGQDDNHAERISAESTLLLFRLLLPPSVSMWWTMGDEGVRGFDHVGILPIDVYFLCKCYGFLLRLYIPYLTQSKLTPPKYDMFP